jgi:hypothetical protein
MTSLMVGIYGLYLIAVGVKGNTSTLISYLDADAEGFVPWLVIVIVLLALYDVPQLQGFAEGVATLVILSFIVSQRSTLVPQFTKFYADIASGSSSADNGLTANSGSAF